MKKALLFFAVFTMFSLIVAPALVSAQSNLNLGTDIIAGEIALGTQDIRITIARIINVAMGLLGIVAVVIILLGGFKWMTAGGNDEGVKSAKKLIVSGIIGLIIIITAYAVASFVLDSLVTATTEGAVGDGI